MEKVGKYILIICSVLNFIPFAIIINIPLYITGVIIFSKYRKKQRANYLFLLAPATFILVIILMSFFGDSFVKNVLRPEMY